jgi:hypothetical protein
MPRSTAASPGRGAKLHLAVDAETGEILAYVLTCTGVGDIGVAPGLLATAEGPLGSVIADGAYDGASVSKAASLRQHDPPPCLVIPPRASSTVDTADAGTLTPRERHIRSIAETGRLAWQKDTAYGRRSLVETAIGRYKHIIGPRLRVRSAGDQQGEVAIAMQILNRMIHIAKPISVRSS